MFGNSVYFNAPIGSWDTKKATDMKSMFFYAYNLNQDISAWETGKVTDMYGMFRYAETFNSPIDSWDVSSVTSIAQMFLGAYAFNSPVDSWKTAEVDSMYKTFCNATSFDQPIEDWDVSKVKYMGYMFYNAKAFDQPIGKWEVGNVIEMYCTFYKAPSFDQPVEDWDVSKVTDMTSMFYKAKVFNQPLDKWEVGNVEYMAYMFDSASKFNQCLSSWAGKTPLIVKEEQTKNMLLKTACPNKVKNGTPSPNQGPWCQSDGVDDPNPKFGKKNKNCKQFLGKLNKKKLRKQCKKNNVKKACPSFCSSSTCVVIDLCADTTKNLKLVGGGQKKCNKIQSGDDSVCEKKVKKKNGKKVKEFCPTACEVERCMPDPCAADATNQLKLVGGGKKKMQRYQRSRSRFM